MIPLDQIVIRSEHSIFTFVSSVSRLLTESLFQIKSGTNCIDAEQTFMSTNYSKAKKCFAWMAQLKQLIPVCPRLPQKYGKQIIVMTNTNLSFVCFCSSIVKSIALQYKGHGFNPKGTHQTTNKKSSD